MTGREDPMNSSGAYSVGALGDDERKAFETFLEGADDASRTEVTELTETAAILAMAVEPVQPSDQLRASVLAKIATLPQLPAQETPTEPTAPDESRRTITPAQEERLLAPAGPAATTARLRWFQRPVAMLGAAAAAVVIAVSGGFVGAALVRDDVADQASDRLAELYAAPDAQRVTADVAGGGSATLVFSHDLDRSAVVFDGLTELPSDKVYELWYIDADGEPRPAGLVELPKTGDGWYVLDGELAEGDTIGVTVEPEGGSATPTTDPVVAIPA